MGQMRRLDGKSVIVTGSGTGIGEAVATLAANEGAAVLVADVDSNGAARVARQICDAGNEALACHLDLADEGSIQAMIAAARQAFGGIDSLINNAAKTTLTARDGSVEEMDTAIWDETMHVNLRGTMLACKHAIPALRERGGGSIVNIASGAALKGGPALTAYGVSKAGIVTLGQYVAAQHGAEGIRCNTIAPGVVLTPKTMDAFGPEKVQAKVRRSLLSPRLGRPMDIAWTVLWLIADEGAYVNGQCISVDGGMTAHQNAQNDWFE
jgi:NAD(P)-dependent dehydrogenase (short-subunit alcohol dehydrogenase family)